MNNAAIKLYWKLKLAVNTLLYVVHQKTHENIFGKISLPSYLNTIRTKCLWDQLQKKQNNFHTNTCYI